MIATIARWLVIEDARADAALVRWEHFLGACNRPFGRVSYGLELEGELVAVAVSASTVNGAFGPFARREVVELARLCVDPDHRDLSRVALRLWRKTASVEWSRFWPVIGLVSYANAARHSGSLYRFDGWSKLGDVRGGVAGGNWSRAKRYEPKSLWAYPLDEQAAERCRQFAAPSNAGAEASP